MSRPLTRTELRHAAWLCYPQCSILDICLCFRGSLNGSADAWMDEDSDKCLHFLNTCIETWTPTDDPFDSLVHQMIIETLRFAEASPVEPIDDDGVWSPDAEWDDSANEATEIHSGKHK